MDSDRRTERRAPIRVAMTAPMLGHDFSHLLERGGRRRFSLDPIQGLGSEPQAIIQAVKGYEALIAGGQKYDGRVLGQLKDSLRIVSKFGSGYDNIDVPAATELGIAVTNAPRANALAVAEHALSLMLCLTRKICRYDSQVRQGTWEQVVTSELYGKTVGIVGFGEIGRWLARLLKGFSCRIMAFDVVRNTEVAQSLGVEYCDLEDIARECDFISLHLPLTPETDGSIGMDFFRKMKRSAFLINTARGRIVREDELVEALQKRMIGGAGLDVYASVPLDVAHPVCGLDNVVLTPHTAAHSDRALNDMMECCLSNIGDFFERRTPANLLNPDYIEHCAIK